jgi:DNA-binding PadR family transcriptional regulator
MQQHRISPAPVLLGFLYKNPCHGYELHQRLCADFGNIWHVSQSQTYTILKRLENQGFICSTLVNQEKLPPRQLLHLTEQGHQWFNAWLDSPTKCSVHAIRVEFITRLYFMHQYYPAKTLEIIDTQVEEVRLGIARLNSARARIPEDPGFNRLALDLRILLLQSITSWLARCRQEYGFAH